MFLLVSFLLYLLPIDTLFWFSWSYFNVNLVLPSILLVYFSIKLLYSDNIFKLLMWVFLIIVLLTTYLFIFQLDVFACFLLVSETVVIFFVLSFLVHTNHTNMNLFYKNSQAILLVYFLLIFLNLASPNFSNIYTYFTDWFCSALSSYNDLFAQYIYLYSYSKGLILVIGSWLLLLTFLLVIVLSTSYTPTKSLNFVNKRQSLWVQWFRKPFTKFFK